MADTYLPPGFKKCKSCQQVKPFEQFGKELKGKFGLKSCRACISEKNKTYAAGPGAEVKTQNNRTYQAENKTELAEKMRVKRAKEKFGDRYNSSVCSASGYAIAIDFTTRVRSSGLPSAWGLRGWSRCLPAG